MTKYYTSVIKTILFLFVLLLFFSCSKSKHINHIISEAEVIVSHNPDSAISILMQIPKPEELTDSLKANYWLVMGQAHYNSGKAMSQDSMLAFSLNYYNHPENKNVFRLLQAYRLFAHYFWWVNKREQAFSLLNQGLDISLSSADTISSIHLLKALVNLSEQNHDIRDNIKYTKMLLEIDKDAPDKYYYLHELGIMFYYLNEEDSTFTYLDSAIEYLPPTDSLIYWNYIIRNYADILSDFGKHKEAIDVQKRVLDYYIRNDNQFQSLSYSSLSRYYLNLGNKDSAFYYLDLAEKTYLPFMDEDLSLRNYYTIQKTILNYAKSNSFEIKDITYFSNRMFDEFNNREKIITAKSENERFLENRNLQLSLEKQKDQMIIMLIVFIVIVGSLVIAIYIQKRKKLFEEKEEELEALKNLVSEAQKTNNQDDKFFKKILLQQLGIIKLVATNPTPSNQEFLLQMSRITNKDIPVDDLLIWDDLYGVIDSIFSNFYTNIRNHYGDCLLEKEYQLCCLLRANFSTKEISVVTQQSIRTIYQRKSTIRYKLEMNEKEDIIEFLLQNI
ncbi:tetratricopeptide repeat protein [Massilibacteroides vaginae]|uniref:tetratricopeptide repeat protein n=1 Tax=Massilibacteroides vaginae TaxID=1673718 RepID=UPI000A1CD281|nr:hypothetical protein [Massilibacteroides vaginae]